MFITHVRVQAAHDREHGWSISFTLYRGWHALPTACVKAPKNFKPNHAMLAKHHTTLSRRDCIGTLWSLYKGMQKTNDPHSYGSGRTKTLPSGQHLSKGCYPKRTGLYPCNPDPPLLLLERATSTITRLINWLRSEPCDTVVAHVSLGGSPCSD
jgi:transposase